MRERGRHKNSCFALLLIVGVLVLCSDTKVNAKPITTQYDGNYGYRMLPNQLKPVYEKIDAVMEQFHASEKNTMAFGYKQDQEYIDKTIHFPDNSITVEQLSRIMFAINADHPRYFWYEGISYTYAGQERELPDRAHKVSSVSIAVSKSYANGKKRKKAAESLEKSLVPYLKGIDALKKKNAHEIQIERFIHDELIERIDYGDGTSKEENTVIGAFVNQQALCEGYAKAFQLLASYAGLESVYAVGYGYGEGHAWNVVKIGDTWCNLDVTWDDMEEGISYLYFNCLDEVFFVSHSYSDDFAGMYKVPKTNTSNPYEYYDYHDLWIRASDMKSDTAFRNKVIQAVRRGIKEGEYQIQFKVEDKYRTKLKKLWSANKAEIAKAVKENGILYEFEDLSLYENVVTMKDRVYGIYKSTITKIEAKFDNRKQYIKEAQYGVIARTEDSIKTVTSKTKSRYQKGYLKIYYKDTLLASFKATVKSLKIGEIKTYVYNGKEKRPNPTVSFGGKRLVRNRDYTLSYKKNVNAGTATLTITGKGIYTGKQQISFTINKKSVKNCTVTKVKRQRYTGKRIKPKVNVYQGGRKLNKKDYSVTYYNNKRRGMASILIRGTGKNYRGTKRVQFLII